MHTEPAAPALPPAIIIGGEANALSVARDLHRMGVRVFAIGSPHSCVRWSRRCTWISIPIADSADESWASFLLGPESEHLHGAVVIACSDRAINVIARHRDALSARYVLDLSNVAAQLDMLDKLKTLEHARRAGVATPDFWAPGSVEEIHALRSSLKFPLLVKPHVSHLYQQRFGRKFVIVNNCDDAIGPFEEGRKAGLDMVLVEWIPGGDDRLSSYYTYLDEDGRPQYHFTKRVIRRHPVGMGLGSYHITDWIPEIVEPSLAFFHQVGLRGFANIEFKYDERDKRHKVMECNARFTATNRLVSASGLDLARFVYTRLAGLPTPSMTRFRTGMRLWDPVRDLASFHSHWREGRLTLFGWIRSVMHRQTTPYFAWSDAGPAVVRSYRELKGLKHWRARRPSNSTVSVEGSVSSSEAVVSLSTTRRLS